MLCDAHTNRLARDVKNGGFEFSWLRDSKAGIVPRIWDGRPLQITDTRIDRYRDIQEFWVKTN